MLATFLAAAICPTGDAMADLILLNHRLDGEIGLTDGDAVELRQLDTPVENLIAMPDYAKSFQS